RRELQPRYAWVAACQGDYHAAFVCGFAKSHLAIDIPSSLDRIRDQINAHRNSRNGRRRSVVLENQPGGILQAAARRGNEGSDERARSSVITDHTACAQTIDVEIAIRSECQAEWTVETT